MYVPKRTFINSCVFVSTHFEFKKILLCIYFVHNISGNFVFSFHFRTQALEKRSPMHSNQEHKRQAHQVPFSITGYSNAEQNQSYSCRSVPAPRVSFFLKKNELSLTIFYTNSTLVYVYQKFDLGGLSLIKGFKHILSRTYETIL